VTGEASRRSFASLCLALTLVLAAALTAHAAGDFKLKKGARGDLCVDCHDAFERILKMPFIHTPLAKGECSSCHNPHTSRHELLLASDPDNICYECHDDLLPAEAESVHQVVVEGRCTSCHDAHAAQNKMILLKAGSELCFDCHEELGKRIEASTVEHDPVTEDCLECHNPHMSEKNPTLLKDDQPALCLECHEADRTFKSQHGNYPVETARCTSCHDPHGSDTETMLFDNVHDPVSDGECDECHAQPTTSSPFALKSSGYKICEGCHYEEVADALNKRRVHWPVVDQKGCTNCHAPHASAHGDLMKEPMLVVCGRCHEDTVARQQRSKTQHPPVAEGECAECHSPHGSDNLFLLNEATVLEVCEACHEWQTHSTHPIGENVVDTRNKNITVQCLSCHRTHGTEYEHFVYFDTTNEMCIQCHTDFRR
jgi:predicted CXXCH cytochrome family protein